MRPELEHSIWGLHQGLKAGLKSICSSCYLPTGLLPPLVLLAHGTTVILVSSPNLGSSIHHAVAAPPPHFIMMCLPPHPLSPQSVPSLQAPLPFQGYTVSPLWELASQGPFCSHFLLLPNHPDITSRLIFQSTTWIIPFPCSQTFCIPHCLHSKAQD